MKSIFLPGLALLLSLTSTAFAQENHELGRMWTFENPPLAYLDKEYGLEPDQEWLDSLRLGSLRLGGVNKALEVVDTRRWNHGSPGEDLRRPSHRQGTQWQVDE